MISLKRSDANDMDYKNLVLALDHYLAVTDVEEHAFYAQFNKSDGIKYVIVAYDGETAVGCGAIKNFAEGVMEVKRMFVLPSARGKGVASIVLKELEDWALQLSQKKCVLETGAGRLDAVTLYQKNGYTLIPNYGQYQGVINSVCFEKQLSKDLRKIVPARRADEDSA